MSSKCRGKIVTRWSSLPEILCLWSVELLNLVCHDTKHFSGQIRGKLGKCEKHGVGCPPRSYRNMLSCVGPYARRVRSSTTG
jgi:hypothetical protein